MELDQRDRRVVELVSRYSQISSKQIHSIVFANATSHTPTNRTLRRLVERRHLLRVERKVAGGSHGGSGQYVYALGLEGHKQYRDGRYIPARAVNYHSLAIVQCYATLVELERAGVLRLRGVSTEPDCHVTIGRYELKPDLFAEYERVGRPGAGGIMFEVDRASQGQRQIMGKFERYLGAYNVGDGGDWPDNQFVLFVAVDETRARELRWLRERLPEADRLLFKVTTEADLYTALSR